MLYFKAFGEMYGLTLKQNDIILWEFWNKVQIYSKLFMQNILWLQSAGFSWMFGDRLQRLEEL